MHNESDPGNTVLSKAVARKPDRLVLILILSFLLPYSLCFSSYSVIYVSPAGTGDGSAPATPTLFQTALDAAHGYDSVSICLLTGTYDLTGTTLNFLSYENEKLKIMIRGGYESDGTFADDPALTVLDGKGVSKIMRLSSKALNADLTMEISCISFINGTCTDDGDAETVDLGAAISAHEGNSTLAGVFHLAISNCIFSENNATTAFSGGAIYCNVYFTITDCIFDHNISANGGAIIAYAGADGDQTRNCYIKCCMFNENMNTSNQGSTIWHNLTLNIEGCEFHGMEDGSLVGPGSCIWGNNGSTHRISRCLFSDILVKYWGSAIQSFGGNAYVDNCVFTGCKAGEEYGTGDGYGTVAFYHNNQPATVKRINNCTFVNNRSRFSTSSGGAIHNRGLAADDFLITNCVFDNNGQLPVYSTGTVGIIKYSCIMATYSGFTDGGGMTALAPAFADDSYHLSETSPCLNTGLNDAEPASEKDIEGNRRILNSTIDMGALELNHAPHDLTVSDTILPENSGENFAIATLSATDDDPEDAVDLYYFLIEGDGSNDAHNDNFTIEGNQLLATVNADFEEDREWDILVGVSDFGCLTEIVPVRIKITDQNDPVILQGTIPDQAVTVGDDFTYTFDSELFTDQDADAELDYTAALSDGNDLPTWLNFDVATRTFTGNSAGQAQGTLTIKVTASDNNGSEAFTEFDLVLSYKTGLDNDLKREMLLYPVPAEDHLMVRMKEPVKNGVVLIYNLNGTELIEKKMDGDNILLDINMMKSGVYLIELRTSGRIYHARFVKK